MPTHRINRGHHGKGGKTSTSWPFPNCFCILPFPLLRPSAAFIPSLLCLDSRGYKIQEGTLPGTTQMSSMCLVTITRKVKITDGGSQRPCDRKGVLTIMVFAHFVWHPIWMVYSLMLFSEKMQYFFSPAWVNIGETAALLSSIDQLLSNVFKKIGINFLHAVHWLTHL